MKKIFVTLAVLALISASFTACGASSSGQSDSTYDSVEMENAVPQESYGDAADLGSESNLVNKEASEFGLKIIYTSSMSIETLNYEESYSVIMEALHKAGGYISYSNQSGGQFGDAYYTARRANFEFRIPVENYEQFLSSSGDFGNVTNRTDNSQDITSAYIDIEARLTALKTQEERLLELLKEAKDIETLLTLEDKLAAVRYEIENYTSQLRMYDNLVEYSTVSIELSEVSAAVPIKTKSFGQELGEAITGSLRTVMTFLRGLVIVLVYVLPYCVIALGIFFAVRPFAKRAKKKRDEKRAQYMEEMQKRQAAQPNFPPVNNGQPSNAYLNPNNNKK